MYFLADTISGTSIKLTLAPVDLRIHLLDLDTSFFMFNVARELNQRDIA